HFVIAAGAAGPARADLRRVVGGRGDRHGLRRFGLLCRRRRTLRLRGRCGGRAGGGCRRRCGRGGRCGRCGRGGRAHAVRRGRRRGRRAPPVIRGVLREELAPGVVDRVRVGEESFVLLVDEPFVPAEALGQVRRFVGCLC